MTTHQTRRTAEQTAALISRLPALMPPPIPRLPEGIAVGDTPPLPTTTPSGAVVGGSLVSFTAELDAAHATDLSYALGFCQLQVTQNQGVDPTADPIGYYHAVTTMLTNIGFVTQGVNFSTFNTETKTVELDQVVVQVLQGLLTGDELLTAVATLNALKEDADDNGAPWAIWSSHSQSSGNGTFSVGAASQTKGPDGAPHVAMDISGFKMTGTETSDRFLWATYNTTSLNIDYGKTTMTFNDDLWSSPGVGDAISAAMKKHSAGYIAGLPPLKL
ncbi:hypothetical protein ACPPVT_03445 [Angustibacter sp. McL0619]|uniref:hypothetical protein n=1 Tax=Angustibacter sp. McL0619 TaxID=3415676 RepID=UPI003CF32DA3